MRFNLTAQVPVVTPYRLDLTAEALRRLAANVVDVFDADGVYHRALADARGVNVIAVRQKSDAQLEVRIAGKEAARWLPVVERMLGTALDLRPFYRRARAIEWLHPLVRRLRGLKPPRYPDLWEALCHAIVFQQISIHAAAAIMRRTIEALESPVESDGLLLFPFPRPQRVLDATDTRLRGAGLSANKAAHLRAAAQAVTSGVVSGPRIEALSTPAAIEALCEIRGIGRWSAAVVMLRGLGRLDVFPLGDSGVAHSVRAIAGERKVAVDEVLEALGPTRGMLYFHLLLGRLQASAALDDDAARRGTPHDRR